ncbi:hypothetical protein ACFUJ0_06460 [Streptomyces sp. NPDC057242]|uniref:hypothetical protein n=1 Tax=unclassified Streptomyces TaxID=2593676 RepID=UPI00363F6500
MSGHEQVDLPSRLSATHRTVDVVRVVTLHGEIDHTGKDIWATPCCPAREQPRGSWRT